MKKVTVLGAGMVGAAIAADLSSRYKVIAADLNPPGLKALKGIEFIRTDLSKPPAIRKAIKDANLVIGALPGFMGFSTLETVIEAGKNAVDISFFGEDPFRLSGLAIKKGVTAVVDCGVAPGLSHMILGNHSARMNVTSFECMVGGLPVAKKWPWNYSAPFSPADVLEEYTRPARIRTEGRMVTVEALTGLEKVSFPETGDLEAFYTDGLRTLLTTSRVPNLSEKTLRYPGHTEYIKVLRDSGFLGRAPVRMGKAAIRPFDLSLLLLSRMWKSGPGEEEFTVMKTVTQAKGKKVTCYLFDRTDKHGGFSSMARTTGFTCAAAAELVLHGKFSKKGIIAPEVLGADDDCFQEILKFLKVRGVKVEINDSASRAGRYY